MKEITLTFSKAELLELAKQLYMGSFFMITYDDYENEELAMSLMAKICGAGFKYANENNDYCHGGPTEPAFRVSNETLEVCNDMVEMFENEAMLDKISNSLANREFEEKYNRSVLEALGDKVLYKDLEKMRAYYKQDIMINGSKNIRMDKHDE